ncbi:MAG: cupredoxin domain-containing protein [Candidatus Taylorbacteria bacterium]|nr:cupredoxin domain-containing protein [Candidatus Taylorbacteria bacterium]
MKAITISIVVAVILIGGAFLLTNGRNDLGQTVSANNVSIVDGKQIIEITARGGYQPRKSSAKAGIPTVIRFVTKGTFDCSSSVRIPSMNISRVLPQSGITDIDIGDGKLGTLQGSCGMGMYPFEIEFQG